jgi:hypothetical protein
LDEWEWQADEHGAEELNELDQAEEDAPVALTYSAVDVPRSGLSPKERYTLRRITDGDVLRMERLPEAEPDGEQSAFVEPAPARPPESTTPPDWARLRYERKHARQRRLVHRTGPPVEIAPAPYRPPPKPLPLVDLPG